MILYCCCKLISLIAVVVIIASMVIIYLTLEDKRVFNKSGSGGFKNHKFLVINRNLFINRFEEKFNGMCCYLFAKSGINGTTCKDDVSELTDEDFEYCVRYFKGKGLVLQRERLINNGAGKCMQYKLKSYYGWVIKGSDELEILNKSIGFIDSELKTPLVIQNNLYYRGKEDSCELFFSEYNSSLPDIKIEELKELFKITLSGGRYIITK